MGSTLGRGLVNNVKEELWSYFALTGILFVHVGIILMVYALKEATPYTLAMEVMGGSLLSLGVVATVVSWYAHRQHRRKVGLPWTRICCCCCRRDESERGYILQRDNTDRDCDSIEDSSKRRSSRKGKDKSEPQPFSTPEFQRYAEFLKRDTAGVEHYGTPGQPRKSRGDSSKRTTIHPHVASESSSLSAFSNQRYETVASLTSVPASVAYHPVVLTAIKPFQESPKL